MGSTDKAQFCGKCSGTGWLPVYRDGLNAVERCGCRTTDKRLLAIGFGVEHAKWTLADFGKKLDAVGQQLVDQRSTRGLLLSGSTGSGKTSYAAAICRAAIDREMLIDIRFYMARALLRRLWATYTREPGAETEQEAVDDLCSLPILVIDDLGNEGNIKEAGVGAFHEILSNRSASGKMTIITTNLVIYPDEHHPGMPNISDLYNAAIASRIDAWTKVTMTGEDKRKRR